MRVLDLVIDLGHVEVERVLGVGAVTLRKVTGHSLSQPSLGASASTEWLLHRHAPRWRTAQCSPSSGGLQATLITRRRPARGLVSAAASRSVFAGCHRPR